MNMRLISSSYRLSDFFEQLLQNLQCHETTKAYIISIFSKYKSAQYDLSKESITIKYAYARDQQDFFTFQNLADWIFYMQSWAPQHLRFASKDYYDTVARLSYYACYKIVRRQMPLYEQLADEFISLEKQVQEKFANLECKFIL